MSRARPPCLSSLSCLPKDNEAEIQGYLKGHEFTWREQETSSLDVFIDGIGWGVENSEAKGQLLAH